jgi:hypothetical protein
MTTTPERHGYAENDYCRKGRTLCHSSSPFSPSDRRVSRTIGASVAARDCFGDTHGRKISGCLCVAKSSVMLPLIHLMGRAFGLPLAPTLHTW